MFSETRHNEVTFELEIPLIHFIPAGGRVVEGPEAEVSPERYAEPIRYYWVVEGEVYEGRRIELDSNRGQLTLCSYNVEWYGHNFSQRVYFTGVSNLSVPWAVAVDGGYLEGYDNNTDYSHPVKKSVAGLQGVVQSPKVNHPHSMIWMGGTNATECGMAMRVSRIIGEAHITYAFAFLWPDGGNGVIPGGTAVINSCERHVINTTGQGDLRIRISDYYHDDEVHFDGDFEDLPEEYRTGFGSISWKGTTI